MKGKEKNDDAMVLGNKKVRHLGLFNNSTTHMKFSQTWPVSKPIEIMYFIRMN